MSKEEQKKTNPERKGALNLLESERGHYILSQALFLAIEQMNQRPMEGTGDGSLEREPSNLYHMKLLYKHVFNMYFPTLPIPAFNMTLDDIKESSIHSHKYLEDVMAGNFIREDVEEVFIEAIETGVLSDDSESERFVDNYMYMLTDKDHVAHFKNKHTKNYVYNIKGKGNPRENQPDNVINLDSKRRQRW